MELFDAPGAAPGLLLLKIGEDGVICDSNPAADERLQLKGRQQCPSLWELVDVETAQRLLKPLTGASEDHTAGPMRITLRPHSGAEIQVLAISWRRHEEDSLARQLLLLGLDDPRSVNYLRELEHTTRLLQGFIETSTEACWCIEYTEPVDLTLREAEIVRQVFDNDCHWSMCNRAMARLYNLPDGLDFNRQRVSAYFRRSPENEAFVRLLIQSNFHVDAAPAVDVRHDGTLLHVENSVRAHIENGRVWRMWGTVRDITEMRAKENWMAQRERELREVLVGLPDAVVVIDKRKRVLALNPAFESTFGWRASDVLGADISKLLDLDRCSGQEKRWFAATPQRWTTEVVRRDGERMRCDVHSAPLQDDENRRVVLAIRPEDRGFRGRSRTRRPKAMSSRGKRSPQRVAP